MRFPSSEGLSIKYYVIAHTQASARPAAVITKDFISAKDLCTYSIKILRQEKIVRDHRADGGLVRGLSGRRVFCGRCDPE